MSVCAVKTFDYKRTAAIHWALLVSGYSNHGHKFVNCDLWSHSQLFKGWNVPLSAGEVVKEGTLVPGYVMAEAKKTYGSVKICLTLILCARAQSKCLGQTPPKRKDHTNLQCLSTNLFSVTYILCVGFNANDCTQCAVTLHTHAQADWNFRPRMAKTKAHPSCHRGNMGDMLIRRPVVYISDMCIQELCHKYINISRMMP